MDRSRAKPRILVFSQRNHRSIMPFRCPHFEFEDVVSEIDSIELLAPRLDLSNLRYTTAKRIAYHTPLVLNPGMEKTAVNDRYDLFFAICGSPTDLMRIAVLGNWRARCDRAVCLIDELWIREMAAYTNFLRILEKFDLVMLYYSQTVELLGKKIGAKCAFLPPGVDTIRFCPYPNPPQRSIDVYSIGRRSERTHRNLLRLAAEAGIFYLHDSIAANEVLDPRDHRILFANIAKRSRYFIVNPGYIDRPEIRGDQMEIGNRYFEGAASGAMMLGERPQNGVFEKLFDWPDALIHVPYDSADVGDIISAIDADPEVEDRIRRRNVKEALMRHDWAYRWEAILKAADLAPMPQLLERIERLRNLAREVGSGEECVSGLPSEGEYYAKFAVPS